MNNKRLLKNRGDRPRAFWGALIGSLINVGAGIYNSRQQAKLQREQIENQNRLIREANERNRVQQTAATLNNYANSENKDYNEDDLLKYRCGGRRRLRNGGVRIVDGGYAIPIDASTSLLQGGSHNQINESGKTGIGIKAGGKEFEAEGGEVIQNRGNEIRVFSAQPMLSGISPAEAVIKGANKDMIFNAQENIKRRNHLRNGRSKAAWGASFTTPDYIGLGTNIGASILSNIYANSVYNGLLDDVDYVLPEYTDESYVAGPTKYFNDAQRANVERKRLAARRSIARNTASSSTALERIQASDTDAIYQLNQLWDEKANKETEMRQANVEREQQVRARNAQNRNTWLRNIADIKNKALNTRFGVLSQKADSNIGMIQSIGSSIGNFLQQGIDNYQADQARRMYISASPYGTAERMSSMGVDFTRGQMKGLLEDAEQRANQYEDDNTDIGIKNYNDALDSIDFWTNRLGFSIKGNRVRKSPLRNRNKTSNNDFKGYSWYNPRTGRGEV